MILMGLLLIGLGVLDIAKYQAGDLLLLGVGFLMHGYLVSKGEVIKSF
jgi:hypothetical protein